MIRELSLVSMGAVAAVALVMSCSDDSPGNVDAAACDCPTYMMVQDVQTTVGGTPDQINAVARCPAEWTVIGGGCELSEGGDTIRLTTAGGRSAVGEPLYACRWFNPMGVATTATAWATCQTPTQ